MADATLSRTTASPRVTVAAAVSIGEVRQLADGRAGVFNGVESAASGDRIQFETSGQWVLTKSAGFNALDGGRAYWDHSANAVSFKRNDDRDFFVGVFVGDAASADTTCTVNLNVQPHYGIDLVRDAFSTVIVKTSGTPELQFRGGLNLLFSATTEAQKVDALSVEGFAAGANAIVEGAIRVLNQGDASALDFNIGIASGTHATDADSIAQHLFIHLDGNALDVSAQSKDGTTTVAAADTTVNAAVGTRLEFWLDLRNPADVQIYIDGVNVLPATVFDVSAGVSTWKLLAHLEKTSDDTPGEIAVDWLRVRTAEQ